MAVEEQFEIKFLDSGRWPSCAPNPKFPTGMSVDMSKGAQFTCEAKIPYPAPRCGVMTIVCNKCGVSVGVTVAGRVDDPHTVKLPCYGHKLDQSSE